jgi:DNA-directed RNA polymerase subunit RPC12/RpoP
MEKHEGIKRHYKCHWCFKEFDEMAVYEPPVYVKGQIVRSARGNQIKCHHCFRFIPKFQKVMLENGKHMHIRN